MSTPPLFLFDDGVAREWRPFTLTRPAGELIFGTRTLRKRAERATGLRCAGHLAADALIDFDEPWAPPVLPRSELPGGELVLLSSRYVAEAPIPDHPAVLLSEGRVVGCRLGPGDPRPDERFLEDPEDAIPDLPRHDLGGKVLEHVWDLMAGNPHRLARDLASLNAEGAELPAGVHRVGDGAVSLGAGVRIAPGVVLDARDGPIRIEDGGEVLPFTYLSGPAWVGPGSTLLGGPIGAVSIDPRCKVHGEVEEALILGYSNKAHDGFLGHAYLGMWVNLGALTTNSDLKNNYGTVRLWTPSGPVDTGERKVGCFIGDHVKTAIGTMLNTGTVVETGSNIFGGMPPKYVPPFSWGEPETVYGMDPFLETAETVMGRRDVALSESQRRLLASVWSTARG